MSNRLFLGSVPGAFGASGRKRSLQEAEEESFDETTCRQFLGSTLLSGETVAKAMKRLSKAKSEDFERVSKMATQLSDHGYMDVWSDPREKIWAHSYATDLTAEQVLFGATGGQEPYRALEEPVHLAPQHNFGEADSWWQYCVTDEHGQAGEYHGPFAGACMLEWQAEGYFTGENVHVFRYEGAPPTVPECEPEPAPAPLPSSQSTGDGTTMQGRRPYQEDRYVVVDDLHTVLSCGAGFGGQGAGFYAVFDGHQGSEASEWCKRHMANTVAQHVSAAALVDPDLSSQTVSNALKKAFEVLDGQFLEYAKKRKLKDGCTACTALVLGGSRVFVANVGDSRLVLSRDNTALRCSRDHNPGDPDERARIQLAGGEVVSMNGVWRVKVNDPDLEKKAQLGNCHSWERPPAMLAVSRSIGDRELKHPNKLIDGTPEIKVVDLQPKDDMLIIGCDGVWDVMTDQEAIDLATAAIDNGKPPIDAARRVVTAAYHRQSGDNITAIAVYMNRALEVGKNVDKS